MSCRRLKDSLLLFIFRYSSQALRGLPLNKSREEEERARG
jgi:hypothetical protein